MKASQLRYRVFRPGKLRALAVPRRSSAESLGALANAEYERLGKVARAAKMTLE